MLCCIMCCLCHSVKYTARNNREAALEMYYFYQQSCHFTNTCNIKYYLIFKAYAMQNNVLASELESPFFSQMLSKFREHFYFLHEEEDQPKCKFSEISNTSLSKFCYANILLVCSYICI